MREISTIPAVKCSHGEYSSSLKVTPAMANYEQTELQYTHIIKQNE